MKRGWKRIVGEDSCLYVIAYICDGCNKQEEEDWMLAVLREAETGKKEIVKIYYLAADYHIQLKEL